MHLYSFTLDFSLAPHPKLVQLQQGNNDMHRHCFIFSDEKEISVQLSVSLCRARAVLPQLHPCCVTFLLDNFYLRGLARERESDFAKAGSTMAQKRDFSEFIVRNEHKIDKMYMAFRSSPGLNWSEDFFICECFNHKTAAYTCAHVREYM